MLYFKVAQTFVKDLQEENKAFLTREKEMVNQLERLQDQKIALVEPGPDCDSPSKLNHANAINEALQGKIRYSAVHIRITKTLFM